MALYGYAPYLLLGVGVAIGAAGVCIAIAGFRFGRTLLGGLEAWRSASRAKAARIPAGPVAVYGRSAQNRDGVPF
jgi:hypothetical protein